MQNDKPMSELYGNFAEGILSRALLEVEIVSFIRDHPRRFKLERWDADERSEFISWLYPTLSKAIDRYKDRGASFDAYLYSLVRWSSVGYRIKRTEESAMEKAYWTEIACESSCDGEAPYEADGASGPDAPRESPVRKRKQVLALTLKCCSYVSEDFCRRIAPAISMRPEELNEKMKGLRRVMGERLQRKRELEERSQAQYYRGVVLDARIAASAEGSARRAKYERSRELAKKRMESYRRQASVIRAEASNNEVARILGVPKGTVDASIYFIKHGRIPLHSEGAARLS